MAGADCSRGKHGLTSGGGVAATGNCEREGRNTRAKHKGCKGGWIELGRGPENRVYTSMHGEHSNSGLSADDWQLTYLNAGTRSVAGHTGR